MNIEQAHREDSGTFVRKMQDVFYVVNRPWGMMRSLELRVPTPGPIILRPDQLESDVVRGIDNYGRTFLALRLRTPHVKESEVGVVVLHPRETGSSTAWVASGSSHLSPFADTNIASRVPTLPVTDEGYTAVQGGEIQAHPFPWTPQEPHRRFASPRSMTLQTLYRLLDRSLDRNPMRMIRKDGRETVLLDVELAP